MSNALSGPMDMLIGGRWRSASDGGRIDVLDPADGTAFASVAAGTTADAVAAADAAADAAAGWASTAPRERAEVLRRAFELMVRQQDDLAALIVRENGKALDDARGEVAYAAEFFRWYSEEAVRIDGDLRTSPSGHNKILVMRQPVGVSLLITPWNFPAAMATRKIAPALAAGCTVILKPAEETPLTALAVGQILLEAGAPPGVVNIITTADPAPVVDVLLHDRRVTKLSFTGSTEVGRTLLRSAGDRVVNSSMELGGNAPFIVLDDADLDEAIAGAMVAKMRNGGEACTAANRFYVHTSVAVDFGKRLAAAMDELTVGPGQEPGVQLGPLVSASAREKVHSLVADAVAGGARVVTGGELPDGPGYFYPPTVLTEVARDARILDTEIFGPVAPIVALETEDEIVAAANATEYGLSAYVYSRDLGRALRLAERLDFGMVGVNRGLVSDAAAPFGGMKESGLGREGGHDGLLEFLETKYIAVDW